MKYHELIAAIEDGEVSYPVVVKPRFGCGSIAVSMAYDREELDFLFQRAVRAIDETYLKYESGATEDKVIFQECLRGQEYGADIINDLNGNHRNVIIRKKIAMRAGETDIAELVDSNVIKGALERLGRATKHIGNMDVDVFLVDGTPYILEMNCRFGGGYPFSHMAGCNLPLAIVSWLDGKEVDDSVIRASTGIIGYKELVVTANVYTEQRQNAKNVRGGHTLSKSYSKNFCVITMPDISMIMQRMFEPCGFVG